MPNVLPGFNLYQVLADIANAAAMKTAFNPLGALPVVRQNAVSSQPSVPSSFRSTSNVNGLTSLVAGQMVSIANTTGAAIDVSALGLANVAPVGGGTAGPLVNIPVTAGQTILTIPDKQVSGISQILRGGDVLTPTTHYTLSQSGSNVQVTLATDVQPVNEIEQNTPTSFQYQ